MLDEYRHSFAGAYDQVMRRLRDEFGLTPTGRTARSMFAILGKLRRESVRLGQIQDVAGCRVVVPNAPAQDELVRTLGPAFESASIIDRRERSSHGYRAVHLVVTVEKRTVEVQVRTTAQQLWAELSEKLSDRFGIDVKYGGGAGTVRAVLDKTSEIVGQIGQIETRVRQSHELPGTSSSPEVLQQITELDRVLESARGELRWVLNASDRIA